MQHLASEHGTNSPVQYDGNSIIIIIIIIIIIQ